MGSYRLPDLHRNSNLLVVVILTQIFISLVWVLLTTGFELEEYAIYSLYAQAVALLTCFLAGVLRHTIVRLPVYWGVLAILIVFSSNALVVKLLGHWLLSSELPIDRLSLFRILVVSLLLGAVIIRCLFLLKVLEDRHKAELQLRVDALQARINPHFLFNSLNSISELIITKPEVAEDAIESLAILFRVNLESGRNQHSLSDEVILCQRYMSLEANRFDLGIAFNLNVEIDDPKRWLIPKLLIQPLLENAVKYGDFSKASDPINLTITETNNDLSIKLSNKFIEDKRNISGNGIAIQNIKDRLFVLYDDQYVFNHRVDQATYYVFIRLPKVAV